MKALVTGASGVVGANLVRELLSSGWTVRTLVRPGPPRRALAGLRVEVAPGDVLDPGSLAAAAAGTDVVFHAAARFSYSAVPQAELERVAVEGTRNMIRAAAVAGAQRVVLTASSVVFGSSPRPQPRNEDSAFTQEDASGYAVSKVRQANAAFAAAAAEGIDLVAVCPTLTVGAWDYALAESNAIIVKYLNDPFRATFPGGCNVVSAVDVARGHRLIAEHGTPGRAYLVGAENMQWHDLHAEISTICGTHGPLTTATHTGAYLTAAWSETAARLTGAPPTVTRDEVKMMGRWYWYDDARARALGLSARHHACRAAGGDRVAAPHHPPAAGCAGAHACSRASRADARHPHLHGTIVTDDARVGLRRMVLLRERPDRVWTALRDELPAVAATMRGIEVVRRLEHAEDAPGVIRTVHEWKAQAALPAAVERFVEGGALTWIERAIWNRAAFESRWTVESRILLGGLTGSGTTRLEPAMGGRGSRMHFEITASLGPGAFGPLGQSRWKGGLEYAAAALRAKTLQDLGAAV